MAEPKTKVNDASVEDFIAAVPDETKRHDSFTLLAIYKRVTKHEPKMWGSSIVGFGQYHYKSERSSQEGDWMMVGFSPRKANLTLYFMTGFDHYKDLLARLGKHKTSRGCLYLNKLSDIDTVVLEALIAKEADNMKQQFGAQ